MKELFEVKKVLLRTDGIKYIIIPKGCGINPGDYVMIKKINAQEVK